MVILIAHAGVISYSQQYGQIEVISYRGLLSESFYLVFGEVRNNGETFIKDVKINISLLDSEGKTIDKVSASTSLTVIPPKRRTPFLGYCFSESRNLIKSIAINEITYNIASEKPMALAFVYYEFINGTLATHILNNSTLVLGLGKGIATNYLKVVAALYAEDTIVGVSAGYLNLPEPGLLWDVDTSGVESGNPIEVSFGVPFNGGEIENADKIIASVESKDFSAQQQLTGWREGDSWRWILITREELNDNTNGEKRGFESLLTLIILVILSLILAVIFLRTKSKKRTLHFRKGSVKGKK